MIEQLPQLHVFGRVAPEDKVRLARLMQEAGEVVAMTGDAVNDAAALKQADVGVAMGSGSEVTKQAGKLVLTDDNFATLVHAVDLGRDIYRRISSYVKLQLTILSSVLQLMLYATILNINGGVALFPMQLLFAKFFVVVTVVIGFIVDVPDPGVMQRPPRTPGSRIATRAQTVRWAITGFIISSLALMVLAWGPDEPSTTDPSASMTMAFAVVALSAVNNGLVMRREREPWWSAPIFPYLGWIILGWMLTWAAVELNMLQRLLDTVSLTGAQWVLVIALSLVAPAFTAIDKAIQLRRLNRSPPTADGVPQSDEEPKTYGMSPTPASTPPTRWSRRPDDDVPVGQAEDEAQGVRGRAAHAARRARAMQEWVKATGAKVCIVFEGRDTRRQGRHDQGDHRAGQPPRVPRRRAARTDRAREVADVRPALHPALPGGRRGRHLRPQLVQPRRRRAGHGLLHRRADQAVPRAWRRPSSRRWSTPGSCSLKYWLEVSADEQTRGCRAASTTRARSGSCPTWTSSRTAAGTTTPGPATTCSPPPTPQWAPWYVVHTDDKRRGRSTSSPTSSTRCPTNRSCEGDHVPRAPDAGRLRRTGPYPTTATVRTSGLASPSSSVGVRSRRRRRPRRRWR